MSEKRFEYSEDIMVRLERSADMITQMCKFTRPPKMSIPAGSLLHANPCGDEDIYITDTAHDAKALISAQADEIKRLRDPWIKVTDRLPDSIGSYLVFFTEDWNYPVVSRIGFAFFNSAQQWALDNSFVQPTHWMPLPKGPQS